MEVAEIERVNDGSVKLKTVGDSKQPESTYASAIKQMKAVTSSTGGIVSNRHGYPSNPQSTPTSQAFVNYTYG